MSICWARAICQAQGLVLRKEPGRGPTQPFAFLNPIIGQETGNHVGCGLGPPVVLVTIIQVFQKECLLSQVLRISGTSWEINKKCSRQRKIMCYKSRQGSKQVAPSKEKKKNCNISEQTVWWERDWERAPGKSLEQEHRAEMEFFLPVNKGWRRKPLWQGSWVILEEDTKHRWRLRIREEPWKSGMTSLIVPSFCLEYFLTKY